MKATKDGLMLSNSEHTYLCEALRIYYNYNINAKTAPITQVWTGLGTKHQYRCAVRNDLMEPDGNHYFKNWYKLTNKGAAIVSHWLDLKYDANHIDCGHLPSKLVPFGWLA